MAKIGVVGTGFVGASSAYAMTLAGVGNDMVLVDVNAARSQAEAADIGHAASLTSGMRVVSGDYAALKGAAVVVIAAGVNQKPGESRLDLLSRNVQIFRSIIPEIVRYAEDAVVLVTTNPVDIMTEITKCLHPHPERVLGSGTLLDTARFRTLLGRECGISPRYIHANVLGEHGDSAVLCWDGARLAGLPLAEFMGEALDAEKKKFIEAGVRDAAATIIAGKQATYYGIGAAVSKIVSGILGDKRGVYTVSAESPYGVCLSLPRVVGAGGVCRTVMPHLSAAEQAEMQNSADVLKRSLQGVVENGRLLV